MRKPSKPVANESPEDVALRKAALAFSVKIAVGVEDDFDTRGADLNRKLLAAALAYARVVTSRMAILQSYEIPAKPEFEVALPEGAQVISFYNVDDKPYIGVIADIAAPKREPYYFSMVAVRGSIDTTRVRRLVGVAVFRNASNPLHLFECHPPVVEVPDPPV